MKCLPTGAAAESCHWGTARKFDVGVAETSPAFDTLGAVTRIDRLPSQSFDTEYFDTRGGDLAAYQIALWRNTGGDCSWHLQLPAGPGRHTEIGAPWAIQRLLCAPWAHRRPNPKSPWSPLIRCTAPSLVRSRS